MTLPTIRSYGNYSSSNYGAHCLRVDLPIGDFYFSYQTLVAFSTPKTGLICRVNDWKQTTGKHLNAIQPDKKKRISGEAFEKLFAETFKE
jgi:hypothetical protein